jgi:hypothetical protein
MHYEEARSKIETGDLIEVRTVKGWMNWVTKLFTGPYVHCGQAIWLDGRLCMAEENGGNHLIPLSQLEGLDFDVYAPPDGLSVADMEASIMANLGSRIDYGYEALPFIGLVEKLKLKLVIHWRNILVCSGYCARNWVDAGWKDCPSFVLSPTKLASLVRLKFAVTPTPEPQADPLPV